MSKKHKTSNNMFVEVIAAGLFVISVTLGIGCMYGLAQSRRAESLKSRSQRVSKLIVPIVISTDQSDTDRWIIGTGELIVLPSKQTAILTNAHVCKGATETGKWVSTVVDGKRVYDLLIMKQTNNPDLCLYYSPSLLKHKALIVHSKTYEYAEELLEIGFPLNGPQTPTTGVYLNHNAKGTVGFMITAPEQCVGGKIASVGPFTLCIFTEDLEETTVPTYPGNSGSPVFDINNDMIGIMNSSSGETARGSFVAARHIMEFIKGL